MVVKTTQHYTWLRARERWEETLVITLAHSVPIKDLVVR